MARKKVKLTRILNDNARKASLKKRRLGLAKKMEELTILCDVEAFLIIYTPNETEPLFWPHYDAVQTLFARYLSIPEIERSKKQLNQEYYLKERKGKMHHQHHKYLRITKEMEATHLLNQIYLEGKKIYELDTSGFDSLNSFIEEKRKQLQRNIRHYCQMSLNESVPPAQVIPTTSIEQQTVDIESSDAISWGQLIMDMMNPSEHVPGNNTTTITGAGFSKIYQGKSSTIGPSTNSLSLQNLAGNNHLCNFSLNSKGNNVEHGTRLPQECFQHTYCGFNQLPQGSSSNGGSGSRNMWRQQDNTGHAMVQPNVAVENNLGSSLRGPHSNHMSSSNDVNEEELPPLPSQLQFAINWPNNNLYF